MKIKDKEKIPVALYIRCNVEKGEDCFKKEQFLRNYCNDKGYNIVSVFRDIEPYYEYYSGTILDIFSQRTADYRKLIALEVSEFTKLDETLLALYEVLADKTVSIETVKEGVLGEDLLFGVTINKNVKQRNDLDKNQSISFAESPF